MNVIPAFGTIAAPKHEPRDFLHYEGECRAALKPVVDNLLDMAESAGWNRRTTASTLMFLAAQHVSASSEASAGG